MCTHFPLQPGADYVYIIMSNSLSTSAFPMTLENDFGLRVTPLRYCMRSCRAVHYHEAYTQTNAVVDLTALREAITQPSGPVFTAVPSQPISARSSFGMLLFF